MFDERKEILNGPPKRVYNETLETPTTVSDHYKQIFEKPLKNFMIWPK